jgi:outer membrane immunogenic protein
MQKLFSSVASIAILSTSAFAADLPLRSPPPPVPVALPMWTGAYGGLNAGYNFGTNDPITNTAYGAPTAVAVPGNAPMQTALMGGGGCGGDPVDDVSATSGNSVPLSGDHSHFNRFSHLFGKLISWGGANHGDGWLWGDHHDGHGDHGDGHGDHHGDGHGDHHGDHHDDHHGDHHGGGHHGGHHPCPPGPPVGTAFLPNAAAISQNGTIANSSQSGFIGGGQFGYNYQWSPTIVLGFETDVQGTGTRGGGYTGGLAQVGTADVQQRAMGGVSVNAGLDYLGTVRGRIGYLVTPVMLAYATGGFAYGGAYANVASTSGVTWNTGLLAANQSYIGGGNQNQILTGWAAGGGLEWMFTPGWSLKTEAIYWDLGSMNVQTASFAAAPTLGVSSGATFGASRVNYQGVIARAGVNYHIDLVGLAPAFAGF